MRRSRTVSESIPQYGYQTAQVLGDPELAALFRYLEGRPLYMPVMLAAATGMRRGEVLAVRWRDIDLDKATLQVAQWSNWSPARCR